MLTLLAVENAVIWEAGILTFSLGYLGKYFIRGSRRISSRSQCSFGTIRSPAALVRQSGGQEESVYLKKSPFPLSQSPGLTAGLLHDFLWHGPFGSLVKIMVPSQNDVFK